MMEVDDVASDDSFDAFESNFDLALHGDGFTLAERTSSTATRTQQSAVNSSKSLFDMEDENHVADWMLEVDPRGLPATGTIRGASTIGSGSNNGQPTPAVELTATGNDDEVFGFGSFEECFITEEDLQKAQEKLQSEEVKTTPEFTAELAEKLDEFRIAATSLSLTPEIRHYETVLCIQNFTYAQGKIHFLDDALCFEGTSLIAKPSTSSETVDVRYRFALQHTSDPRLKQIESKRNNQDTQEETLIMLTLKDNIFLQFLFPQGQSQEAHACLSELHSRKSNLLPASQDAQAPPPMPSNERPIGGLVTAASETGKTSTSEDELTQRLREIDNRYSHLRLDAELTREERIRAVWEQYETEIRRLDMQWQIERDALLKEVHAVKENCAMMDVRMAADSQDDKECELCYASIQTVVLNPCGHGMCSDCYERLEASYAEKKMDVKSKWDGVRKCPWCRAAIVSRESSNVMAGATGLCSTSVIPT